MKRYLSLFMLSVSLIGLPVVSMQIDDNTEITLKSNLDSQELKVSYNIIKHCETIKQLLEDVGPNQVIPLPNISKKNLNHIIKIIELSLAHDDFNPYELTIADYIRENIGNDSLADVLGVANYLDCTIVMDFVKFFLIEYLTSEDALNKFEENPSAAPYTALPNGFSKNLAMEIYEGNEWISGKCYDHRSVSTQIKESLVCPLTTKKYTIPVPNSQIIGQDGSMMVGNYDTTHIVLNVESTCMLQNRNLHFSVFVPEAKAVIVCHNEATGNSTFTIYSDKKVKFDSEKRIFSGLTTCLHASKNAVARGVINNPDNDVEVNNPDNYVEVYDQTLEKSIFKLDCKNVAPTSVALSPTSDLLAYALCYKLYIHSPELSQTLNFDYEEPIKNLVFDDGSRLLAFTVGNKIHVKKINVKAVSSEQGMLWSEKEFVIEDMQRALEHLMFIPGTDLLIFSHDKTLWVINPLSKKCVFKKTMNGYISNILLKVKKESIIFLEECDTTPPAYKTIDLNLIKALDIKLSIQQIMLLKLIKNKEAMGKKLNLRDKKDTTLCKIFESLPPVFQVGLSKVVMLPLLNRIPLLGKMVGHALSDWWKN